MSLALQHVQCEKEDAYSTVHRKPKLGTRTVVLITAHLAVVGPRPGHDANLRPRVRVIINRPAANCNPPRR